MGLKNSSTSHSKKLTGVILLNLAFIVIGIAGLATGTMAWFASNVSAEVEVGSFSVVAVTGVEFDLYYLDNFSVPYNTIVNEEETVLTTEIDGNYDEVISEFAGYETNYEHANFVKVNYSDGNVTNNPNPMNIKELWPNHKLTFAIIITSETMTKLTLKSWGEKTLNTAKVSSGTSDADYVHLSWAINIYGKAYSVANSGNDAADVATGFASYWNAAKDNRFGYSQASPATPDSRTEITTPGSEGYQITVDDNIDIIGYQTVEEEMVVYDNTVPANAGTNRTIAYFTIEFSDDNSTYYELNSSSYWTKNTSGNSNCYEKLSLTSLEFAIS